MKGLLLITGILIALFLVMVLFLYVNQRSMLYYPQGLSRDWVHVQNHARGEVSFTRDGVTLRGWLLNPDNRCLLIYYGGNGEEVSYNLDSFNNLVGCAVLLMNFRGFGESEGSPTEMDLVGDALHIFDQFEGRYDTTVLLGRSLGSGIAVQVASQRTVDRLILVTPYDSITSVAQGIYPWAPVSLLIKDRYDSLALAPAIQVPALFLIAENDTVIPMKHARKLADAWGGPVEWEVIPGTSHNSISSEPAYWDAIKDFIRLDLNEHL